MPSPQYPPKATGRPRISPTGELCNERVALFLTPTEADAVRAAAAEANTTISRFLRSIVLDAMRACGGAS